MGQVSEQLPPPADPAGTGDEWARFYHRYHRRVLTVARRICWDRDLAEEVCQDVFLAVWRNRERFDPTRGTMFGWLLVLTHHKAVDALRREQTRRHLALFPDQDSALPAAPGADDAVLAALDAEQVRAALRRLPAAQREALV